MVVAPVLALVLLVGCGRINFDRNPSGPSPEAGAIGDGSGNGDGGVVDGLPANACVQDLAVAHDHSCARLKSGDTWCWGHGTSGALGNGGTVDQGAPVLNVAAAGALQIAIGGRHGCAIVSGTVTCWGANTQMQQQPPAALPVTRISVGSRHSCADTVGNVTCWGCSDYNTGSTDNCATTSAQLVNPLGGIVMLSGKHWHTCAIRASDGSIWCWGENSDGELGNSSTVASAVAVRAGTLVGANYVSAGRHHTCALVGDRLYTWGDNDYGALGDGTLTNAITPTEVMTGVAQCSAGGLHTCMVTTAGAVRCFGDNARGQLGDGMIVQSPLPVDVVGLPPNIVSVEAGARHTCARTLDEVWCWGRDTHGQIGNGATTGDQLMPIRVTLPCP